MHQIISDVTTQDVSHKDGSVTKRMTAGMVATKKIVVSSILMFPSFLPGDVNTSRARSKIVP